MKRLREAIMADPARPVAQNFFQTLTEKSILKSFDSDMSSVEVSIEVCSFLSRSCSLCRSCREASSSLQGRLVMRCLVRWSRDAVQGGCFC